MAWRPQTLNDNLRTMRILYCTFVLSVFLYEFSAEQIGPEPNKANPIFVIGLAVVSLAIVIIALGLRRKYVGSAEETLRLSPDNPTALGRWRVGQILSLALAESVAVYGLALRLIGTPLKVAAPFYVGAIVLMALWWPQRP